MIVTYVMIAVCVVGVLGAIGSALSYDKPYGQIGDPMRIPRRSRRTPQVSRRPSRQLQALEAALSEDAADDETPPRSAVRSHGGRTRR